MASVAVRDTSTTVPVFTCSRSTREAPCYAPTAPVGTPQSFSTGCQSAAGPGVPAGTSTVTLSVRTVVRPIRQVRQAVLVNEGSDTGSSRMPSRLAPRAPVHLTVLDRPGFVRAACHRTRSLR